MPPVQEYVCLVDVNGNPLTGPSGTPIWVQGDVAAGATDSGNPVKIGGVYTTTNPTLTNGQRGNLSLDTRQNLRVAISNGDGGDANSLIGSNGLDADARSGSAQGLRVLGAAYGYNGATWDRLRVNNELTLLVSAARTIATNTSDQVNYNAKTLHVQINITAYTSGGLTATIQGKDPVSGTYYTILAGVKLQATGLQVLKVGPGILAAANAAAQDMLPRTWRVSLAVDDATSITYSVGASLGV